MAVVAITGGSRGIGAATVRSYAARGDQVFFLYQRDHDAARQICEQTGAQAICCDVADGASVFEAFRQIGPVDILVCNAGISISGLIQDLPEQDWDRLFDVNVKGVYNCIRAALPGFFQKGGGSVVTVSSMWGQVGASCEAAYSATKGAVIALTKALAQELGPSNIRVNCVAPGVIATDMCAGYSEADLEALRQQTPLGRLGTPEDVTQAILSISDGQFITGQVVGVNGGFVI